MDPKHPNIAFAANTGALVFIVGLLFSFFLPVGTAKGWAMPESTLAVLIPLSFAISWWAKREHDIPIVHAHGGANSQYEEMEDLPTMVSLDSASENVNPNTAAVIASIIGEETTQKESAVSMAINTLSTGTIGESAAAAVAHNDVDHTKVNTDKFDHRGFQTQGIESVPLPVVPALDLPSLKVAELPEMPDLEDLLSEDAISAAPPPLDLPDLPDF
jgi:hypothetical protein